MANMQCPIPTEKQVTTTLWKLATSKCYQSVANQYDIGRSTVGAIVRQVCCAVQKVPLNWIINLGNAQVIIDSFAHTGFPNCTEAIDGTYVPIICPCIRAQNL